MKQSLSAGVALAALLSSASAFAAGPVPAPTREPNLTLARPAHVVAPMGLPARFKNTIVQVSMLLDANGTPHEIAPARPMPDEIAKRLLPVVAQWRFTPVCQNGRAVSARVILPIELVEGV